MTDWGIQSSIGFLVERWLPVLVDSAWKGAVLLALASVTTLALRRASAATRHLVWTAAIGGVLLLPLLSATLPLWRVLPPSLGNAASSVEPDRSRTGVPAAHHDASTHEIAGNSAKRFDGIDRAAAVHPAGARAESATPNVLLVDPRAWLLIAWALGAFAVIAWVLAGWARMCWLVEHSRRVTDGGCHAVFDEIRRELGISSRVRLIEGPCGAMPMAFGGRTATVLLPHDAESWPTDRLRTVILHELAHVRRRDGVTLLLARAASAIFWFHPLVWIATRRLCVERERAADDQVLRSGSEPTDYAEHLLTVASGARWHALSTAAGIAMARSTKIEARLQAILDATRSRREPSRGVAALAFVGALAMVTPLSMACATTDDAQPIGPAPVAAKSPATQTRGTEEAVLEGLRWLMRHQNPNGSWSADKLSERCLPESTCVAKDEVFAPEAVEGLTGLALLAFLGAGYSDESRQVIVDPVTKKRLTIRDTVKQGLSWLTQHQNEDGSFSDQRNFMMYNEAIATLAMCEAYGLTRNPLWRDSAQRAVRFLVDAQLQNPNGSGALWGWRYRPRFDLEKTKPRDVNDPREAAAYEKLLHEADTSVTCWVIMALKSAVLADFEVPQSAFDGALDFVKWVTPQNGNGLVGYLAPEGAGGTIGGPGDQYDYHVATMSALGVCIRTFIEHNPNDPFLDLAAKQLLEDLPLISKDKFSIDYYYWYFGSLALYLFDGPDGPRKTGKYWGPWNKAVSESILSLQDKSETSCSKGGWLVRDRWSHGTGPLYQTAINVLTLEILYRYDNALHLRKRPR
ncbi:MAG: hypothetical protein HYR85_04790 [Planctomycetes bacterium]|nr:hypothetical protein [Planctomycetota bacterium]MBI3844164.1 hypothetical protein [Planctomycetota bacterium]